MFICNDCLRMNFNNGESSRKSHRECQLCRQTKTCNEIESSRLRIKIKAPIRASIGNGNN